MNDNRFWFIIMGGVLLAFIAMFTIIMPTKIKNDVKKEIMQELHRSYAPGPYNPGFDPDRVDPGLFFPQRNR